MIKRSINMRDEMYEKLQAIAKRNSVSFSMVVRIACSEYIKRVEATENLTHKQKI